MCERASLRLIRNMYVINVINVYVTIIVINMYAIKAWFGLYCVVSPRASSHGTFRLDSDQGRLECIGRSKNVYICWVTVLS